MADYKLTPEQADALLHNLSTDEGYRSLFQTDLTAAFAKLPGSPKPPDDISSGCCLEPQKLASMEQIQQARTALQKSLTSLIEYKPHLLEEG
jgi:putative modified peptide